MQGSDTKRLAKKIRKLHERKVVIRGKKVNTPFRIVCEELNIRTPEGKIDPGLAYKIGYKEYEPAGREMQRRLGLRERCSKCKRAFRALKSASARPAPSAARVWFGKLKREEREKVIEFAYQQYLKWRNKQ